MIKMKKILKKGKKFLLEKNSERVVFIAIFLFLISVVVYSAAPNPGHLTTEVEGYGADANLQVTLDDLQESLDTCADGEAITEVNIDGTVTCGGVTAVWGAPTTIIARDGASTGNMGGYDGMADYCGAGEHVCSAEELTAWEQNGGADRFGWYNGGVSRKYDSNTQQNDCSGWTSSSSNYGGNLWNQNRINYEECNNDWDVLCCKY